MSDTRPALPCPVLSAQLTRGRGITSGVAIRRARLCSRSSGRLGCRDASSGPFATGASTATYTSSTLAAPARVEPCPARLESDTPVRSQPSLRSVRHRLCTLPGLRFVGPQRWARTDQVLAPPSLFVPCRSPSLRHCVRRGAVPPPRGTPTPLPLPFARSAACALANTHAPESNLQACVLSVVMTTSVTPYSYPVRTACSGRGTRLHTAASAGSCSRWRTRSSASNQVRE